MSARVETPGAVYAVLGHPVAHSLSPAMQNAAFRAAGIDAVYLALDVAPARLADTLSGLHAAGVAGVNLTAPHKEAAWRSAKQATPEATLTRAPNTLRREPDGWMAHATDGPGFAAWIAEGGVSLSGARVLLLGAGGAARSLLPTLAALGAREVGIVSRSGERARNLAAWAAESLGDRVSWQPAALADARAAEQMGAWAVAVRALSSDSIAAGEDSWWARLSPGAAVLDLNYGARCAAIRARADRDGRRFEDGLGLLLHQGALSFEFWTGRLAPLEAMREALAQAEGT